MTHHLVVRARHALVQYPVRTNTLYLLSPSKATASSRRRRCLVQQQTREHVRQPGLALIERPALAASQREKFVWVPQQHVVCRLLNRDPGTERSLALDR